MRLLVSVGNKAKDFLDDRLRNLSVKHLEIDEIWTFVEKKQGRLTPEEKAGCNNIGDIYLWTALDQETKLLATFALGKRSADNARRFMVDLASRIKMPKPHDSDDHAYLQGKYDITLQISTDGFQGYPEAVDLAFGPYVQYGQIKKDYRNADQPGRYAPPEIIHTERKAIFGNPELFSICTSHVERNNLTIRTLMQRFTRLSLGFSKKLENLAAACALYVAYYNFCWRPRKPGNSGRYRATPAMAAGITDKLWKIDDLFTALISN
jgi:IS1 family transposase